MTNTKLPFKLLPEEVTIWLNSLKQLNSAKTAIELNNVAKQLRTYESNTSDLLIAVIQLTPTILHTCDTIELSFSDDPQPKKYPVKVIKLCIQLLKNTGLAFCNISKLKSLSTNELNLANYLALQFIGHAQRLSAIFHEPPSSSFWKEIARIYKLSLAANTNQKKITHNINKFKEQLTIDSAVKRNILFSLCAPYQYSSSQIKQLFLISNSLANSLILNNTVSSANNIFYWDTDSADCPNTFNNTIQYQQLNTKIDTKALLTSLQSNSFVCNLDQHTFSKLFDHLSGYQSIINSSIPSAPTISQLLRGFDSITKYLTKLSTLQKIQQFSTEVTPGNSIKDISKQDNLNAAPQITYSTNYQELLNKAKPVKTLQVNNEKYIIAETNYTECNIDSIVLLCHPNLKNELGIIRQVKVTNASKTVHILIEKIPGVVSIQQAIPSRSVATEFISIQNENTHYVLFPSPCKLTNGSKISYTSAKHFILEKLIYHTRFFSLYQIS